MTGTARMTSGRGARRRSIGGLAVAAAAGLLVAPAAGAGTAPACDADDRGQRPALVLRGLPAHIAPGRDIPFRVERAARGATGAVYRGGASVAVERPHETNLLTEYFLDARDDRMLPGGMPYWIRMRRGEAPATVVLAYHQDTPAGRCRVRLARAVRSVAPHAVRARLTSRRRAGRLEGRLTVGAAGGCWRARAGTTIVRVSGGGDSRTIRLTDLCERWSPRDVRLPGLRIGAVGAGASRALALRAEGRRGGRYRVAVSFRGRAVLRRSVVVG